MRKIIKERKSNDGCREKGTMWVSHLFFFCYHKDHDRPDSSIPGYHTALDDPEHVRELTLRSLKKTINQLKEEIARFQARVSPSDSMGKARDRNHGPANEVFPKGGTKMVITLGPDLEVALNELANRQGVAPEELAANALRERFLPAPPLLEPRDEWERRLRDLARNCGVSLSNLAVSSEGLYD